MAFHKIFKSFEETFRDLKENNFLTKRNIILALIIGITVLSIPIGIQFNEYQRVIKSRAEDENQCSGDLTFNPAGCQNGSGFLNASWSLEEPEGDGFCNVYLVTSNGTLVGHYSDQNNSRCTSSGVINGLGNGNYTLMVSNGKEGCNNKQAKSIEVNCPQTQTPPPGVRSPSPGTQSPPPGLSACTLDKRTPALSSSCASCIIANAQGAIAFIRGSNGNQACTPVEAASHWCNGGTADGQRDCNNLKNNTCRSECGGGTPVCQPDRTTLTLSPSQPRSGERVTFTFAGEGVTWIEEDYGGGTSNCSDLNADPANSRGNFTCTAGNAGNYTWVHKWSQTQNSTKCSKPQTYTITAAAATANNATCGTLTAPTTATAGQSFNVSITMNNPSGSKNWTGGDNYRLGRWDGTANNGWVFPDVNKDRVNLPSSPVNTGGQVTFNFAVTAPASAGTKNLDLRMVQDGVEWFGATCSKQINVTSAADRPATPTGFNANLSRNSINLSWNKLSDVTIYKLRGLRNPTNADNLTGLTKAQKEAWYDANIHSSNGPHYNKGDYYQIPDVTCTQSRCSYTFTGQQGTSYTFWVDSFKDDQTSDVAAVIWPAVTTGGTASPSPSPIPSSSPSSSPSSPSSSPTTLACDFNRNGSYDDGDFTLWLQEFLKVKTTTQSDCTGDGRVDLLDFNRWRNLRYSLGG